MKVTLTNHTLENEDYSFMYILWQLINTSIIVYIYLTIEHQHRLSKILELHIYLPWLPWVVCYKSSAVCGGLEVKNQEDKLQGGWLSSNQNLWGWSLKRKEMPWARHSANHSPQDASWPSLPKHGGDPTTKSRAAGRLERWTETISRLAVLRGQLELKAQYYGEQSD